THGWLASERFVHSTDATSSPGSSSVTYQPRASPRPPSHTRSSRASDTIAPETTPSADANPPTCPSAPSRSVPSRHVTSTDPSASATADVDDAARSLAGAVVARQDAPEPTTSLVGLPVARWSTIYNGARRVARSRSRPIRRGDPWPRPAPPPSIHGSAARS